MPAIPAGVIVAWPSTAASIPAGWSRVAALDGVYPRSSTTAVGTGGAATHTHTASSHRHYIENHTHPMSGLSQAAGNVGAQVASGSDSYFAETNLHDHAAPADSMGAWYKGHEVQGTYYYWLGYTTPTVQSYSNDLAYWSVIWIQSDGTPTGVPNGAVALWAGSTLPTGWTHPANGKGRYLKGAAAGANGGTTGGSLSHAHAANNHFHNDADGHIHKAAFEISDGPYMINVRGGAGDWAVFGNGYHHHPRYNGYADLDLQYVDAPSGPMQISTAAKPEPSYVKPAHIQNASGAPDYPAGLIAIWLGDAGSIPAGWKALDGTEGTPDWNDSLFLRGAETMALVGTRGGVANPAHGHTSPAHDHGGGVLHSHGFSGLPATQDAAELELGDAKWPMAVHDHGPGTVEVTGEVGYISAAACTIASASNLPPYRNVILIQYQAAVPTRIRSAENLFGQTFRVFDDDGPAVSFERRDTRDGAFSEPTGPFGEGSHSPDIECLADGRLRVVYLDGDGNLQQRYSRDDGETWEAS